MIEWQPEYYLTDYSALREVIAACRQHFDEQTLQAFTFQAACTEDGEYDAHLQARVALMLTLSADYTADDRPLIRWLIRENSKVYNIGLDISQETALCAFMLYKFMTEDDILVLYACKFAYGCSEQHAVDTEIVLGFGWQETLDYLQQHADQPHYQQMKQELEAYCVGASYKPRAQFIDFFEQRRFRYWQEQVAECYGFIDLNG